MSPADLAIIREHMRKLGAKGGKRRLETMTPEERSKAARRAGKASGRSRRKAARAPAPEET